MEKKMKQAFLATLIFVTTFLFSGCTHQYALKENWVDDDDLISIVSAPDINKWSKQFGTPVFTEIRQDTAEFIYNYKPHLYKSVEDNRMFKPNNKDRVDLWNDRTEYVGIVVYQDKIIQVHPRPDYAATKEKIEATESSSWIIGLIGGIIGTAALVITIVENN
ncbi:hypothetical protein [Fibrobacter sp. UWB13]|jgi:hypothetical protein|uniref:hypothetical protein n=2 Tax=unclassified Fibrobacter TaxID=2634177 RepID=UPI00111BECD3|nr:hypothetical protein [Fibrobacter sp. UWB13]